MPLFQCFHNNNKNAFCKIPKNTELEQQAFYFFESICLFHFPKVTHPLNSHPRPLVDCETYGYVVRCCKGAEKTINK